MGDRTYAQIAIYGRIETVEIFGELIEAIEAEWLMDIHERFEANADGARQTIVQALIDGDPAAEFHAYEVNYGNFDTLTSFCQSSGLSYHHQWDAGGDYEAGSKTYIHGDGEYETEKLESQRVETILKMDDPIAELRAWIELQKKAAGATLPSLSVSDAVRDHLAVEIARERVLA